MKALTIQVAGLRAVRAEIQRLRDQADELAFCAWNGTQRCADCRYAPSTYCARCTATLAVLERLGFGEQMREWAG